MRVTQVEYRQLSLTMNTGFKTANDVTVKRPLILIAVTLDDNTVGYGEVQAFDNHVYAPQNQADALAWLDQTLPTLTQWQGNDVAELLARLPMDGQFARAGLEMALWDAVGKQTNQSLADMLGQHTKTTPVGIALGLEELTEIATAHHMGYGRIKLKQQDRDLQALSDIVAAYPTQVFSLDYNASLADTPINRDYLKAVSQLGIDLIEEPFSMVTMAQYQTLAHELRPLRISLDEQLNTLDDVSAWLAKTDVPAYTIKQGKLGGISQAMAAMKLIVAQDRLAWIGGMLASGLGRAVDAALASQLPIPQYPADISQQTRYFTQDIVMNDLHFDNGTVHVPNKPGIGVQLDWDAIKAQQVGDTKTVNLLQKG